jgi:glycosyltransferase involved in cell wall biosynthesis
VSPEVSVVIPTHDRSDLLSLTLRTVLWQRDVDLEIIVVDDGSTDDTVHMVEGIGDQRILLLHHVVAQGVSAARNRGIGEARGEWIAFLDDDDLWAPDKLRLQLKAARGSKRTWAYGGAVKIDAAGKIIGGTPPPAPEDLMARLPRWNLVPGGCSNVIVTSEALSQAGEFDRRLVNLADWDLWIRIGRTGPPARVPDPLVGYRIHGANASRNSALIMSELELLDRRYGASVDRGAFHHYLAWVCLRSGDRRGAVKHFARAASHGEVSGVFRDLASLASRRAGRLLRSGRSQVPQPSPDERWRTLAAAWLSGIEQGSDRPELA